MDALTTLNLEDTLHLGEKSKEASEKDWDKMNRTVRGLIKFCLTQDVKYYVLYETSARKIWEIFEKKYLTKSIEIRMHLKRKLYHFQLKKGLFIDEHTNNYTNILAYPINVDVTIEKEDKAVILLNSLLDEEFETFILILINGKQTLNYGDVSAALVNNEVRRKDKQSSSNGTSAKAFMVRGKGSNRKGNDERGRSKSRLSFRDLKKSQCAFCKELRHWEVDYSRIKDKNKESKIEANLTRVINTQSGSPSQAGDQTHAQCYSLSLSLLFLLVTQVILSGC